jgi:hypothetical protein
VNLVSPHPESLFHERVHAPRPPIVGQQRKLDVAVGLQQIAEIAESDLEVELGLVELLSSDI